ncbi:hypothetical protein EX895_005668 [Sporisorium graminicola]|uniref:Uncharacterized protein n=1 Tax=Sporisorium graminicola TaxID=280036 RepID=A0A4U7KNM7_9BASI|nr:hypothetical protein EX895_005668 [Sporisorium graminicola]TKY85506.1 hypothetical protein EX895_005668 [Sporisorium graminicola]
MARFISLLSTLFAVCTTLVLAQASNDDPRGKELYVNYPSCDYYRCQVTWYQKQSVYVNWLNAPKGGLKIQLAPQDGVTGLQTYTITDKVGSVHGFSDHKCNSAGTGEKCGRFDWVVPANVKPGQYQVIVTSLAHPDKYVGYTDTVVVKKAKSTAKAKGKAKRHDVQRLE